MISDEDIARITRNFEEAECVTPLTEAEMYIPPEAVEAWEAFKKAPTDKQNALYEQIRSRK